MNGRKKIMKKASALLLTATVCLSVLSACTTKNGDPALQKVNVSDALKKTDIDLVKNGQTEYVIVEPLNATNYEAYAVKELELYFESASGADVEIVKDTSVSYDQSKKYLSVGNTTLLAASGVAISEEELGTDGYKIVRQENTVIMAGGGGYGTLYSVYEFLHHSFGWEPYAIDEIYYERGLQFKLPDFNLTDVPIFAVRSGDWYYSYNDAAFAAKWRTNKGTEYALFNERIWYYFPHAHFKILPPQTYKAEHPDWYAASEKQICLSSQGAYDQFLINLKNLIVSNPSLIYIPLGGEDSPDVCVCKDCQEAKEKYGVSGQTVRWINRMVADVTAWMEEEGMGDRTLYFPMLAYYATETPPTKLADGKHTPIDESCVLNEKSPLIFAPIASNRQYSIMDEKNNRKFRENLIGWDACSEKLMFYLYNDASYVAFEWYDASYGLYESFRAGDDLDVMFIHVCNEGQLKQARAFQVLEGYVQSKLQWNPYEDVNKLTDDFIKHYYREGAQYVSDYYYLMKTYYRSFADDYNEKDPSNTITTVVPHVSSYNRVFIEQLLSLLDKAHEAIDAADYTEAEKEIYHQRITIESFTQRFILLENFSSDYSKETYLAMVDAFEEDCITCGIQQVNGRYPQCLTNEQQFAAWRKKVQG